MKRNTFYWAIFLIAGGLLLLVKNLFNLRFGSFSVLFALGLIVLGIYLVTSVNRQGFSADGGVTMNGKDRVIFFSSTRIIPEPDVTHYTIVFSNVSIDMPPEPPPILEVTSLFSQTRIALPQSRATRVKLTAAFGTAGMPGFRINGFGEHEQLCGQGTASFLAASSVFGSVEAY